MKIARLDHLVLTVDNVDAAVAFYEDVLGMTALAFDEGRMALHFGDQKINLHEAGREIEPHAARPVVGSADLCFVIETPIEEAKQRLEARNVEVIRGPVAQTGALGPMTSIYFRDPSGNLIELARYGDTPPREPER